MIFKHIGPRPPVGDYSKEDVAATLLHSVCDNLVTTVLNAMHLTKTTHAFMVGSFITRKSVQDLIIEKFEKRKWLDAISSAGIVSAVAFSTTKISSRKNCQMYTRNI